MTLTMEHRGASTNNSVSSASTTYGMIAAGIVLSSGAEYYNCNRLPVASNIDESPHCNTIL